jgi:hypothetical protein
VALPKKAPVRQKEKIEIKMSAGFMVFAINEKIAKRRRLSLRKKWSAPAHAAGPSLAPSTLRALTTPRGRVLRIDRQR